MSLQRGTPRGLSKRTKGNVRGIFGWFKAPGNGLARSRSKAHVYTYGAYLEFIAHRNRGTIVFVPQGKRTRYER